ncbi:MAG: zinc-dependent peptidase [Bacteroidales bacterium]|nr:zinc-dependent peptidase [Bacteroidales bacterium]
MNDTKPFFILIVAIAIIILFYKWISKRKKWKDPTGLFPAKWKKILIEKIPFYNNLTLSEKDLFEYKIQEFLANVRITGIETIIDETDKILVAASAIVPIFAFDEWQYVNLDEVLIYPSEYNSRFETADGEGEITDENKRNILGMVGTGYMEGKMILSKNALHHGFRNETDKKNTAIHEFVHLIDKMDGSVDGIPELLLQKQYAIPWIDLIHKEIANIFSNKSDINPYGTTNNAEFFAVISEYFFERPSLLKTKHPELYEMLEKIFNRKMAGKMKKRTRKIRRNDPCPCGKKEKFKNCCGKAA